MDTDLCRSCRRTANRWTWQPGFSSGQCSCVAPRKSSRRCPLVWSRPCRPEPRRAPPPWTPPEVSCWTASAWAVWCTPGTDCRCAPARPGARTGNRPATVRPVCRRSSWRKRPTGRRRRPRDRERRRRPRRQSSGHPWPPSRHGGTPRSSLSVNT